MVLPRISTCLTPKWHFFMVSFNPARQVHLKTVRMFRVKSAALLAAIPMPSTYWAHWSVLTTGSKYSCMELEKTDTLLLRPCACFLVGKGYASKIECNLFHSPLARHLHRVRTVGTNKLAEERLPCHMLCWVWQSAERAIFFPYSHLQIGCFFFLMSRSRRIFPLGFLCAKMGPAYFKMCRTVMIQWLSSSASSTTTSCLGELILVILDCKEVHHFSAWVSPRTACSSQCPFCVWQNCKDS